MKTHQTTIALAVGALHGMSFVAGVMGVPKYAPLIADKLAENGMLQDLSYLAMIEEPAKYGFTGGANS